VQSINSLSERQAQQTSTKTAVDAVKEKLISLKDDFRTTTTTLSKQVTALQNQIEIEKRRAAVQTQQTSEWFINLILVIVSLVVIVMLARRVMARAAKGPSTYTSSTSPR
jgi:ATP-dependent Zn protease